MENAECSLDNWLRGYSLLYDVMLSSKSCRYVCGHQICLASQQVLGEALCSWKWPSSWLPMGSSEYTLYIALLSRTALALPSQLFQYQPVSFLTFILIVWSSCCKGCEWGSSCGGFSCLLGLSHNNWGSGSAGTLECDSSQRLSRKLSPCFKEAGCHADTWSTKAPWWGLSCC